MRMKKTVILIFLLSFGMILSLSTSSFGQAGYSVNDQITRFKEELNLDQDQSRKVALLLIKMDEQRAADEEKYAGKSKGPEYETIVSLGSACAICQAAQPDHWSRLTTGIGDAGCRARLQPGAPVLDRSGFGTRAGHPVAAHAAGADARWLRQGPGRGPGPHVE